MRIPASQLHRYSDLINGNKRSVYPRRGLSFSRCAMRRGAGTGDAAVSCSLGRAGCHDETVWGATGASLALEVDLSQHTSLLLKWMSCAGRAVRRRRRFVPFGGGGGGGGGLSSPLRHLAAVRSSACNLFCQYGRR